MLLYYNEDITLHLNDDPEARTSYAHGFKGLLGDWRLFLKKVRSVSLLHLRDAGKRGVIGMGGCSQRSSSIILRENAKVSHC